MCINFAQLSLSYAFKRLKNLHALEYVNNETVIGKDIFFVYHYYASFTLE